MKAPFKAWAKRDFWENPTNPWVPAIEPLSQFKVEKSKIFGGQKFKGFLEFSFNGKHKVSITLTEAQALAIYEAIATANEEEEIKKYEDSTGDWDW